MMQLVSVIMLLIKFQGGEEVFKLKTSINMRTDRY